MSYKMAAEIRRKSKDREAKRNAAKKDEAMRGNRDWQHAQVRPPKRVGKVYPPEFKDEA